MRPQREATGTNLRSRLGSSSYEIVVLSWKKQVINLKKCSAGSIVKFVCKNSRNSTYNIMNFVNVRMNFNINSLNQRLLMGWKMPDVGIISIYSSQR
jgi:hypothetical protein